MTCEPEEGTYSAEDDTAAGTRQEHRLRMLIQANQMLAQMESLPELLPRLLSLAQDVTEATASSILLYDSKEEVLRFALARNDTSDVAQSLMQGEFTVRMGEGIAGTVASTRRSMICGTQDFRIDRSTDAATGFCTRSMLCVPILYKQDLLGVAQVLNPRYSEEFREDDLEILESFAHLAGVAMVRSKLLDTLLEQERVTVQLNAAARIQQNFLPKLPALGNGSHIWASTQPAIHVGGDMYDCIPLPDGRIIMYIADVAGKGLGAALIGTAVWARMRSIVMTENSPSSILKKLNEMLINEMENALFITVCVAVYDTVTHAVALSNAGHLLPVLAEPGTCEDILLPTGLPLGIEPDLTYDDHSLILQPGQSLLLLSDGITEARNRQHEMYGDERVAVHLRSAGGAPYGQGLMQRVDDWQTGIASNDDKTIVELWRER